VNFLKEEKNLGGMHKVGIFRGVGEFSVINIDKYDAEKEACGHTASERVHSLSTIEYKLQGPPQTRAIMNLITRIPSYLDDAPS
jgi:hypothetical protein